MPETFITLSASSGRNDPVIPRILPCLAALLSSLLNTYPLPSLLGIIPSAIINVSDLMWSVIIRILTSVSFAPLPYSIPDFSTTPSSMYLIVSISNMESTPCIIHASLSSPIPVSILGCARSL